MFGSERYVKAAQRLLDRSSRQAPPRSAQLRAKRGRLSSSRSDDRARKPCILHQFVTCDRGARVRHDHRRRVRIGDQVEQRLRRAFVGKRRELTQEQALRRRERRFATGNRARDLLRERPRRRARRAFRFVRIEGHDAASHRLTERDFLRTAPVRASSVFTLPSSSHVTSPFEPRRRR